MTTAHRPTWAPARGHEEQGGMRIFAPSRQVSAKNQAAHTKLKFRCGGCSGRAAPYSCSRLFRVLSTVDGAPTALVISRRQEGQNAPHELEKQDLKVYTERLLVC
eukprot:GHUV01056433.1.p2 GENE.GHUV01056433.1~~GHUV01056433.1.p2  ORF type:complete len:105 (-),score=12.53 GHUV01056433.1:135-449(-)